MAGAPPPFALPPARAVLLPGRGQTFVRDAPGPEGAPTLLLLHGWTVTADLNWFLAYGPLAERFRVVALDHRGHGQGIRSWRPFRLEDCADDAAALADELGLERVIPVGYSMGGAVAQLLWRRHPRLVAGMVLAATAASFGGTTARSRLYFSTLLGLSLAARFTPSQVRRQVADNLIRRRLQGAALADWGLEEMQRADHAAVLEAGWAIGRFSSEPWLGDMDVPAAVVVTALDQVVSPHRQRRLADAIPEAAVFEVEGDHGVCVTDPDRFLPALLEACTGVAVRAGLPVAAA
ncbi:MAG: alpha/beta hydrolase [Actinomycetota bacterium]|nr:alpha/beta hydrolase [Actinomycetota bacterium]